MASYGTTIDAPVKFDSLVRRLLYAAQRRAKSLDLRMTYRHETEAQMSHWDLVIDGNGYFIAAWAQWIERDLPIVAEGYEGPHGGVTARNVAESLVARFFDWCFSDGDVRSRVTASGKDPVLWFWPVLDVPNPPHRLAARLEISDGLVARWLAHELPDEVAIEELHTVVEGTLRSLLGVGKSPNWPSLLSMAATTNMLTASQKKTLASFNATYRNRLKHRAEAIADADRPNVRELMYQVIDVTERLLASL